MSAPPTPVSPPTRVLLRDGKAVARRVGRFRLAVEGAGAEAGKSVDGAARALRVGSRDGNDLVLSDATVSRYHLEIEATPEGYVLRDLGSTNGTLVDGLRVRECFLPPRCRITAGAVALRFELLGTEEEVPLPAVERFEGLIGRSPAIRELYGLIERVAPKDLTVLVEGESGTGKELVAEAIHARSSRTEGPFVVFDCAAVAGNLIESELFGHEKGAFTGAVGRRIGRFEEAGGGTLFLDEIGELPLDLQPKLLRALERREIRRVGGAGQIPVDARVVAATNRDLAREVNRGAFREDLYYRLAVVRLAVPPLRERKDDITLLVEHFVRRVFGREEHKADEAIRGITPEIWRRLLDHPWPGNVRELRNFIERSLALAEEVPAPAGGAAGGPAVAGAGGGGGAGAASVDLGRPFTQARDALLADFERRYLAAALEEAHGNLSAAARRSGLDRMYFKRLCRRHSLVTASGGADEPGETSGG